MNTEKHYAPGGEDHYKRVKRLQLSWCRANITKYAERTKGTPTADMLKVIDYAAMELEGQIMTEADFNKLKLVAVRIADLVSANEPKRVQQSGPPAGYGAVCAEEPRSQFIARPGRD